MLSRIAALPASVRYLVSGGALLALLTIFATTFLFSDVERVSVSRVKRSGGSDANIVAPDTCKSHSFTVDAFVQEEINNIDRSQLFLDVFVTDEFKTLDYNEVEEEHEAGCSASSPSGKVVW